MESGGEFFSSLPPMAVSSSGGFSADFFCLVRVLSVALRRNKRLNTVFSARAKADARRAWLLAT